MVVEEEERNSKVGALEKAEGERLKGKKARLRVRGETVRLRGRSKAKGWDGMGWVGRKRAFLFCIVQKLFSWSRPGTPIRAKLHGLFLSDSSGLVMGVGLEQITLCILLISFQPASILYYTMHTSTAAVHSISALSQKLNYLARTLLISTTRV